MTLMVEAFAGSLTAQSAQTTVSLPAPPPDPLVLNGKVKSARSVKLQWNAVADATEYRIFTNETTPALVTTVSSKKTNARINNLEPDTTVQFQVEAAVGSSVVDSNWISVTTKAGRQPSIVPENGMRANVSGQTLRSARTMERR